MSATKKQIIYLGSDHAGFALKTAVKDALVRLGYHVHDLGAFDGEASDYPDFIIPAARAAAADRDSRAIVFGGSGLGECIAANKVRGVRAAIAYDAYTAKMSRLDNDANVLCLGGRTVTKNKALAMRLVRLWLATPFSGAKRHARRLRKIARYESGKNMRNARRSRRT